MKGRETNEGGNMRRRVPGYITTESSNQFGLDVSVQRQPFPKQDFSPSGDPVPEGKPATNENLASNKRFREVIPPGVIGSSETEDLDILTPPQYIDTVEHYHGEQADPSMHGAVNVQQRVRTEPTPFQAYGTFQPRTAPMPRNASDDVCLPYKAEQHAADPLMNDKNSSEMWSRRTNDYPVDPYRKDLYGANVAGVLHNEGHPGFSAVQGEISKRMGVPPDRAGAILAASTRNASPAAKKANPNLKKVPG
jgi:hypothetical protein